MSNVQSMAENGHLKHYAVFLKLKGLSRKSCIFSYTQEKLAATSGMSRSAIRKYVKFFLSNNWCRIHSGNLIFNKLCSFDENKQKLIIPVNVNKPIKEILSNLYLLILKKKQIQFDKFKKLKRDLYLSQDTFASKKAEWLVEKLGVEVDNLPNANDKLKLSVTGMSKLFGNCSKGKAAGIIKQLKLSGAVKCITGKRTVIKMPNKQCIEAYMEANPNTYTYKGFVWKVECNSYVF